MNKQQNNTNRATALYCRLSHEDELRGDSMSIQNQRDLLTRYAADNNYGNVKIYADDGYTGTNFNRPAFQDMLTDIELLSLLENGADASKLCKAAEMAGGFDNVSATVIKIV